MSGLLAGLGFSFAEEFIEVNHRFVGACFIPEDKVFVENANGLLRFGACAHRKGRLDGHVYEFRIDRVHSARMHDIGLLGTHVDSKDRITLFGGSD